MEFSERLVKEVELYLTKKMGSKPNKRLTEQFLRRLAKLGKLFKENTHVMGKES